MAPNNRVAVRKEIADRLELLRRDNVKRHNMVTERNKLKTDRYNAQKVRQSQIEYDQLLGSASRGTGLDKSRGERMQHLAKLIGQYK
jgi:hypothetical protein